MPGIIVQSMVFGGFVTALGLSDDLKKGLIDRFRSLPMWRAAVVAGRILGDIGLNVLQLVIMLSVGFLAGFRFSTSVGEVLLGLFLVLFIGYAFSWVFAFLGLTASSPESANAYGFTISSRSRSSRPPSSRSSRCRAGSSPSPRTTRSRRW